MNGKSSKLPILTVVFLITAGIVFLFEQFLPSGKGGSLLYVILFWVAIVEGSIAVVAAGEVTTGKWIKPYRKDLLSVYPFLLLLTFLFIIFIPRIKYYPWIHEPGWWMNVELFAARSIFLLLLAFAAAWRFAKEVLNEGPRKSFWAIVYLFVFITSQTSVAFDWVMSLEYPWYSTLFGAYFFIEAFYAALAFGGILTYLRREAYLKEYPQFFDKSRYDLATLLFGFATFWGAQFYTQYIVIWYGNLPEEVFLLADRISRSPWRELSYSFIIILFVIPFITFIFRKAKASYTVFLIISVLVWVGLLIERLVLISPRLQVNPITLILEGGLTAVVFIYMFKNRESLLPTS